MVRNRQATRSGNPSIFRRERKESEIQQQIFQRFLEGILFSFGINADNRSDPPPALAPRKPEQQDNYIVAIHL
jgi:hypothetical protein